MVKKRKLSPASGDEEEKVVDRISMLPNDLIHYIMSFIGTQYAVRACVLSKRWIHIWKSLPFLNFDFDDYPHNQSRKFNGFVDKVFTLRDDCNIHWFKLRWNYLNGAKTTFTRWIDASIERGVQEVTIEPLGDFYFRYEIPPRLLNSKSLRKLTLRMQSYIQIILPKSMSLPQLKFMSLEGISSSDIDFSKRIFSSCPVLETLNMVDCCILTVESLSLKQFAYTNKGVNPSNSIFKLSAPNLNIFTCKSYVTQDYNLQNSTDKLSDATFNILCDSRFTTESFAMKLLVAVEKVKQLELLPGFLEVLSKTTNLVNCQLPFLCNLQTLRLKAWLTRGSLRSIAYLLTISPNIKNLILKPEKLDSGDAGDDWEVGLSLPGILSHLRVVRIQNVVGCGAEFKVLGFLMKNAKGLEEVALYPYSNVDCSRKLKKQFKKKLRALPRASPHISMRWGATKSTRWI